MESTALPRHLVLASTSPFRRELLGRLGLAFEAAAPQADETPRPDEEPARLVRRLAEAKARAVASRYPTSVIIGSDQVACIDSIILGKPGTRERAMAQLRQASGRAVDFFTGLCVLDASTGEAHTVFEPFRVHFRRLTDEQIAHYLDREAPFNCAGAFKSEGLGIALFRRLEGEDPNALVGLPLIRLVDLLAEAGIEVL
jgi:MAF protein